MVNKIILFLMVFVSLSMSAEFDSLKVFWTPNEDTLTEKYEVYRFEKDIFEKIKTVQHPESVVVDYNIQDFVLYKYFIIAIGSNGRKSEPSDTASFYTQPTKISISEQELNEREVIYYQKNRVLIISSKSRVKTIKFFDVLGRKIHFNLYLKRTDRIEIDVDKIFNSTGIYIYYIEFNNGNVLTGKIPYIR